MAADLSAFIKSVLAQTDIVTVIQSSVSLKKAGHNYQGLCPFHHEKTPSFSVNPSKQFFYCFGCHASGDALNFIMRNENLSFMEALEKLATTLGMTVPTQSSNAPNINKAIYQILRDMVLSCRSDLQQDKSITQYLKDRGIKEESQRKYHIGYCGPQYQRWFQKSCQSHLPLLLDCGVAVNSKSGKPATKFYQRLMFPIQDSRGKIIGFGGRSLNDQPPKYLNSPESDLFKKRYVLYGLYQFRALKRDHAYVVEGYMDVLALHSHGIPNAVACLGTAFTIHHWQLIKRFVKRVTFCFDADRAGRAAAWKSLLAFMPVIDPSISAQFLFLPEKHDPDSYLQEKGKASFEKRANEAVSWVDFFMQTLAESHTLNTVDGRAGYLQSALSHIELMENDALKTTMTQAVHETVGVQTEEAPLPATTQNRKNDRIEQYARAIIAQLAKKTVVEVSEETPFDVHGNVPLIEVINRWHNLLRVNPALTGEALRAELQGNSIYTEISTILSQSTQPFNPIRHRFSCLSLRLELIEQLIKNHIQLQSATSDYDDRKLLQSLIMQKQAIHQQRRKMQVDTEMDSESK